MRNLNNLEKSRIIGCRSKSGAEE